MEEMSNKDRFFVEISSFLVWRNNIERRKGEEGERKKIRDNGLWFINIIRIKVRVWGDVWILEE